MAIDVLTRTVLRVELFQGLKPLQITEIARRAERIVFKAGDVIAASGQPGDAAILVASGTALRLRSPGGGDTPEPLPVGALIGEMCMLVESEHSSTIVARDLVRALRITRRAMMDQMAADPSLAEHLVAKIAGRLRRLAMELRQVDATMQGEDEAQVRSLERLPAALGSDMAHAPAEVRH